MSTEIRLRRGTSAQNALFTGANAEVTVDTTLKTLRVHDGATAGGSVIAKLSDLSDLIGLPEGRLTVTAGTAITTADAAGQPSIYYTPCIGSRVPIYNGSAVLPRAFAELTLALDPTSAHTNYHQAANLYDLFVFDLAGVVRLGTGPKWTLSTAGASTRGTGAGTTEIERFNGFWVNKNAIVLRYGLNSGDTISVSARQATFVGTTLMSANGLTDDTKSARYLSNAYNKVERFLQVNEAAASWVYSTTTLRQVNANVANQLNFVSALPGDLASAQAQGRYGSSTATDRTAITRIGFNQKITADETHRFQIAASSTTFGHPFASWKGYPPIGLSFIAQLEIGAGTDVQTWYSFAGMTGISGVVLG